jgi:hypothetical protein
MSDEAQARRGERWLISLVAFQLLCQLSLLTSVFHGLRVFVRTASFAVSLVFLVIHSGRGASHPAAKVAPWVLATVAISLLNPLTDGAVAGFAQVALYAAILGPLFWVPRLSLDTSSVRRVIAVLWIFQTVSALAGVLQVAYPGQFQPDLSTAIVEQGPSYVSSLLVTLDTGQQMFRPMGLSDIPGGAGFAGFAAVLFGSGFWLTGRRVWVRGIALASMLLGMVAVYTSQVRVAAVVLGTSLVCIAVILALRRQVTRLMAFSVLLIGVAFAAYTWVSAVGAQGLTERLQSLVGDPAGVYYQGRGHFLKETLVDYLPEYPLGAGLGRWGMTNVYFGKGQSPPLYAEIQWTGWLFDGGIPLVLAYGLALALSVAAAGRIAMARTSPGDSLWAWGAILVGYDVGAVALTFDSPGFVAQGGLEFWLLNAILYGAAQRAGVFVAHRR